MTESPPEAGAPDQWRTAAVVAVLVLLGFTAALMLATFPAGTYAVFSGRLSGNFTASQLVTPYYWVGPLVGFFPFSVSAGGWFAFLTAVYALLVVSLLLGEARPAAAARRALKEGVGTLLSSPFLGTVVAIGFLTFTASLIDAFVSTSGVPIGGVTGDPFGIFLGFATAPLIEEVGFRVILIGLVAYILSLGRPLRTALAALWKPSVALEGAAVWSGTSIILWAAVAFSSATFGACHVACGGGGWQIGKLPEAIYGGVVLGYVYVKYGFPAAVITHWGIDYFGSAFAFFGQAAYAVPWNSATTEYLWQYVVDFDLIYVFGVASFILVAYVGVRKLLSSRGAGVDKAPQEGVPPYP